MQDDNEDNNQRAALLGFYLIIVTSCRTGSSESYHTGIFTLRSEHIKLNHLNDDFVISLSFDGKYGIPFKKDFVIDKVAYQYLEHLIKLKPNSALMTLPDSSVNIKKIFYVLKKIN